MKLHKWTNTNGMARRKCLKFSFRFQRSTTVNNYDDFSLDEIHMVKCVSLINFSSTEIFRGYLPVRRFWRCDWWECGWDSWKRWGNIIRRTHFDPNPFRRIRSPSMEPLIVERLTGCFSNLENFWKTEPNLFIGHANKVIRMLTYQLDALEMHNTSLNWWAHYWANLFGMFFACSCGSFCRQCVCSFTSIKMRLRTVTT